MDFLIASSFIEPSLFLELALVIAIGAVVAIVMRMLKQPLIVSHIITGLIVGPFFLNFIHSTEIFKLFSEIGIAILLFTVGLNLSPSLIRQFGKISLVTGIGQVVFTAGIGYFICRALGYAPLVSGYVSVALAFSSTIIILKLLSDKNELESLHAKIATGFLLVQDFIALILMFAIPVLSAPDASWLTVGEMFLRGGLLTFVVWLFAQKVLRPLNNFLATSQELLFLFSLAWGFIIAAIFKVAGFSLETGALIAGVSLAALPARYEISGRLAPLRDFFIVIFFIMLGAQMALGGFIDIIPKALLLSAFVLIGNPIIVMIIMGIFGYRKKTAFKTGLAVAQISEFSLILITLGLNLSHLNIDVITTVTLVGLITIFISTYMILHADNLYMLLEDWLGIFERKKPTEKRQKDELFPVLLFGCNRIGYDFMQTFKKNRRRFLVIDYNPETIEDLEMNGVHVEFGDAGDIGFVEAIDVSKLELAVSTIPILEINRMIAETIRKKNKKAILMMVAHSIKDALDLYECEVDYVILPHFLGGQYAADMLIKMGGSRRKFATLRNKHLDYLASKATLGHDHPDTKKN